MRAQLNRSTYIYKVLFYTFFFRCSSTLCSTSHTKLIVKYQTCDRPIFYTMNMSFFIEPHTHTEWETQTNTWHKHKHVHRMLNATDSPNSIEIATLWCHFSLPKVVSFVVARSLSLGSVFLLPTISVMFEQSLLKNFSHSQSSALYANDIVNDDPVQLFQITVDKCLERNRPDFLSLQIRSSVVKVFPTCFSRFVHATVNLHLGENSIFHRKNKNADWRHTLWTFK